MLQRVEYYAAHGRAFGTQGTHEPLLHVLSTFSVSGSSFCVPPRTGTNATRCGYSELAASLYRKSRLHRIEPTVLTRQPAEKRSNTERCWTQTRRSCSWSSDLRVEPSIQCPKSSRYSCAPFVANQLNAVCENEWRLHQTRVLNEVATGSEDDDANVNTVDRALESNSCWSESSRTHLPCEQSTGHQFTQLKRNCVAVEVRICTTEVQCCGFRRKAAIQEAFCDLSHTSVLRTWMKS